MKTLLKKKLRQSYIVRLKKDLLLLLSYLERLEPRRREYVHHRRSFWSEFASLAFMLDACD